MNVDTQLDHRGMSFGYPGCGIFWILNPDDFENQSTTA